MNVGDQAQLVMFRIGEHRFAFNVFQVERILRYEQPVPLPQAPDYLEGMIRFGQEVVPVIDLRKRLEEEAPLAEETRIVVLGLEPEKVGIVVDAVLEVKNVPAERVQPPPNIVRGLAAEYISGILTQGETTTVVLAASKLLTSEERIVIGALTAEVAHE
ncbi:MAG: chemotaxis protein CheW [Gemmatimonadota bacterium]|nr:MAG: chemotaxis protein CheW [Gemmatimonadota bacterium]